MGVGVGGVAMVLTVAGDLCQRNISIPTVINQAQAHAGGLQLSTQHTQSPTRHRRMLNDFIRQHKQVHHLQNTGIHWMTSYQHKSTHQLEVQSLFCIFYTLLFHCRISHRNFKLVSPGQARYGHPAHQVIPAFEEFLLITGRHCLFVCWASCPGTSGIHTPTAYRTFIFHPNIVTEQWAQHPLTKQGKCSMLPPLCPHSTCFND